MGALLALASTAAQFPRLPSVPARPPSLDAFLPGHRGPGSIPPIVFVSRHPVPGEPGAVPGLGPAHRTVATGGRLLVREPSGRLRELVPATAFYDVADPAVSFDGRRVAFAATVAPDGRWRLYLVGLDGQGLRPLTGSDPGPEPPAAGGRHDDFDPCWIGERRLCFASTRYPMMAQYADVPASNLYVLDLSPRGVPAGPPRRITSERNGAEEPALDPRRGELVFARWWFNRFQAARGGGLAPAAGAALPRDSVNLWETVALGRTGLRLACGGLESRRAATSYQTAFLRDGTPVGVYARNLGFWPRPVALGIQRFPGRVGRAERVAGAAIPDSAGDAYSDASGLASPSACAPAGLPDGRVVFAFSPGGRGDYGIYLTGAAGGHAPRALVDLPGTLELDPAPATARRPTPAWIPDAPLGDRPPTLADFEGRGTFTYRSLDVFRAARPALGAPGRSTGARVRFYASLPLAAGARADTAILLREVPVGADGSVEASGLPADVPMFEQLVDASGVALASAHGPAHVAGLNAGTPGRASRCVGCHFGHSTIVPPPDRPRR